MYMSSPLAMVTRRDDTIYVSGNLHLKDVSFVLNEMFHAVKRCCYKEIFIDFSQLYAAFADALVPICADSLRYKINDEVSIHCKLPNDSKLSRTFVNTNWAHLIDDSYDESIYAGYTQYPTKIVRDDNELGKTVNDILDCILRATHLQHTKDFSVIEWTINEIIENALRHSHSSYGGLVHLSRFLKNRSCIEIVVADSGIGIPLSLRQAGIHPELSDCELIEHATGEGITNGNGMGNGLFGAMNICRRSNGYFKIYSKYGLYDLYKDKTIDNFTLHTMNKKIPFNGTMVCIAIDFSVPGLLEQALKFKDGVYSPPSVYLETLYDDEILHFIIKDEVQSFSTRKIAEPFRQKVLNMYKIQSPKYIKFDCNTDSTMSSSFADELFGKLSVAIGMEKFNNTVIIENASEINDFIIKRAISQRAQLLH